MTGNKTRKVLDLNLDGVHLVCIRADGDNNPPYRVYKLSIGHRKLLVKYGDFMSVLSFLRDFYIEGMDAMPLGEIKARIAERSI